MNKFLFLLLANLSFIFTTAQTTTVTYDQQYNHFNGGVPLPAQKNLAIQGNIHPDITKVEVLMYKSRILEKPVFKGVWMPDYFGQNDGFFNIFLNQMLRSNEEYSFRFRFFVDVDENELNNIVQTNQSLLSHYLKAQAKINKDQLSFAKSPHVMLTELNQIVNKVLRSYDLEEFTFSDIVKDKINQISKTKLKVDDNSFTEASLLQQLEELMVDELKFYVPNQFNKEVYSQEVLDYPTEKLPNVVGLNVGYAATFINEIDHMGYAPYIGFSIPLGNSKFAPFMSKMSASAGIFLRDLEGENQEVLTGPIVKKPVYLGLGYRIYDFIRLNAGVVALENENTVENIRFKDVEFRPFVGLSIDLNLWIGLGKQKPVRK